MLSHEEYAQLVRRVERLLYLRGVDRYASFRVCEQGVVVLKLCNGIPEGECAFLIRSLREEAGVSEVWAEQGGRRLTCE